jgi:hypothetical protein
MNFVFTNVCDRGRFFVTFFKRRFCAKKPSPVIKLHVLDHAPQLPLNLNFELPIFAYFIFFSE